MLHSRRYCFNKRSTQNRPSAQSHLVFRHPVWGQGFGPAAGLPLGAVEVEKHFYEPVLRFDSSVVGGLRLYVIDHVYRHGAFFLHQLQPELLLDSLEQRDRAVRFGRLGRRVPDSFRISASPTRRPAPRLPG